MHYELVADNPQEAEALAAFPSTRIIFDPLLPLLQARSLMVAVRLGIFGAMADRWTVVSDLAATLDMDRDSLELVLRVLTAAGYVRCEQDRFRVAEITRNTLLPGSSRSLAGWVEYNRFHWEVVTSMDSVLQSGQGVAPHASLTEDGDWAVYQQAMLETARPAASWVAAQVPVREGAECLLDLGGAHGLYGAAICRLHPPLRSEVLELPAALAAARELARQEGIVDVVSHRAGDVLRSDLGSNCVDVVFLGNLSHHFTPDQNRSLMERIRTALRPGGSVVIWDFQRPTAAATPDLVADGLALLFRLGSSTRCYTEPEYRAWLSSAGFQDIQTVRPPQPAQILVTGRAG